MTAKDDVTAFLMELRALIAQDNFRIEPRNYPDMFAMGINIDGVILEVQTLTVAHYSQGPELDDRGREGEIWIFGKDVGTVLTYIKVRVVPDDALCISFHPARHPMPLPYK